MELFSKKLTDTLIFIFGFLVGDFSILDSPIPTGLLKNKLGGPTSFFQMETPIIIAFFNSASNSQYFYLVLTVFPLSHETYMSHETYITRI